MGTPICQVEKGRLIGLKKFYYSSKYGAIRYYWVSGHFGFGTK